eukprot:CAMPEP_0204120656 /NCGR_PEP_ID=MMETSP0361-20130328/7773_1 /ASSEMBLY_ACC=CAM_ASM_000343 /TAXON_ID=268821 /ORGANISM="Scrippsiella Hangoei, Strain SHTV-5" /LENGTH=363 /DNA_ID=CAMNT_0051071883 /DNA_START=57 /DNA_END=1146 /DNA_ORIENTATION=+
MATGLAVRPAMLSGFRGTPNFNLVIATLLDDSDDDDEEGSSPLAPTNLGGAADAVAAASVAAAVVRRADCGAEESSSLCRATLDRGCNHTVLDGTSSLAATVLEPSSPGTPNFNRVIATLLDDSDDDDEEGSSPLAPTKLGGAADAVAAASAAAAVVRGADCGAEESSSLCRATLDRGCNHTVLDGTSSLAATVLEPSSPGGGCSSTAPEGRLTDRSPARLACCRGRRRRGAAGRVAAAAAGTLGIGLRASVAGTTLALGGRAVGPRLVPGAQDDALGALDAAAATGARNGGGGGGSGRLIRQLRGGGDGDSSLGSRAVDKIPRHGAKAWADSAPLSRLAFLFLSRARCSIFDVSCLVRGGWG